MWYKLKFSGVLLQVPLDLDDPNGIQRQMEQQKIVDEAEPLTEEEIAEKEKLLEEVRF